jgi:hypothetical protein
MAHSRLTVDVTAKDIEKAHIGDSYKCVVAQAIARQVPDARRIEVDVQTIRWSDDDGRHVFLTPYTVAGYVVAFDAGEELHPFRFQLRDPVPSAQKRARTEPAKAAKASRGRIQNERRKLAKAQAVLADPTSPPDKVAQAQERVAAGPAKIIEAETDHEELKAAYREAGESIAEERITETTREAPPRVYKSKRREYGHRVLRVNQAEGRKHYAG